MLSPAEVKKLVKQSLELVPIGKGPKEIQNGKDFYKYMFTHYPNLRQYFKGAESFTADDVQKSERSNKITSNKTSKDLFLRFDKQGQRILVGVYVLADTIDDEPTFRAYSREMVNKHRPFKMEPEYWSAFFTVWVNFLASRGSLTNEQKKAWEQLGKLFDEECQSYLKALGLPHC
ncbi:globin [Necator americanus]|uniref:Globin n=1 Tax=Necator americanus TaxID=51031 RepID=W2TME1_NECAM|nr:globin [Necator americanus]ETN82814.1 globin [Necator americanus]